jgi:hypothetical protein
MRDRSWDLVEVSCRSRWGAISCSGDKGTPADLRKTALACAHWFALGCHVRRLSTNDLVRWRMTAVGPLPELSLFGFFGFTGFCHAYTTRNLSIHDVSKTSQWIVYDGFLTFF